MQEKEAAWQFFSDIRCFLNRKLPKPETVREVVPKIVERAKTSTHERHKAFPEGAFLNEYIAPAINEFLMEQISLNKQEAKTAFLSESFRNIPDWASGSPARALPHPFHKAVGSSPQKIIARWQGLSKENSVVQSCPDMAIRPPAPFKVVIEGKYVSKGGSQAAATSLAMDIYQAFFYLGLSRLPETATHPAWDYDYSCLISYDATPEGNMLEAWESLDPKVKRGCWEGANIFVMILRGNS